MTPANPLWQRFDLSEPGTPDSVREFLDTDGGVVAVLSTDGAAEGGWSDRVAIRLAELLAQRASRVLLIDLALHRPTLAASLDESPAEGISDVLLFGASLHRVVVGVQHGAFLFASSGTVVGDPSRVLGHPELRPLLSAHSGPGSTVVLALGANPEGVEELLGRADRIVVLGLPDETPRSSRLPDGVPTLLLTPSVVEPVVSNDIDDSSSPDETGALPIVGASQHGPEVSPNEVSDELGAGPTGPDDVASLEDLSGSPFDDPPESFAAEGAVPEDAAPEDAVPEDAAPEPVEAAEEELDPFWDEAGALLASSEATVDQEVAPEEPEIPLQPQTGTGETLLEPVPSGGGLAQTEPAPVEPVRSTARIGVMAVLLFLAAALIVWGWMGRGDGSAEAGLEPSASPVQVSASRAADPPAGQGNDAEGTPQGSEVGGGDSAEPDGVASSGTPTPDVPTAEPAPAVADASDGSAEFPEGGLRFGLTINSHERLDRAQSQAAELARRFPDLDFVLAPVAVNGIGYVRVIAGPAPTEADADRIRERMSSYLGASVAAGAIVRATRLAYELGDFDTVEQARARVDETQAVGISSYIVEIADGGPRYRVLAGAYGNQSEATYLQIQLADAGLEGATLSERTGRPLR